MNVFVLTLILKMLFSITLNEKGHLHGLNVLCPLENNSPLPLRMFFGHLFSSALMLYLFFVTTKQTEFGVEVEIGIGNLV